MGPLVVVLVGSILIGAGGAVFLWQYQRRKKSEHFTRSSNEG